MSNKKFKAPTYLDKIGKEKFTELVSILDELGLLDDADKDNIILYAEAWSTFRNRGEWLKVNGTTYQTNNNLHVHYPEWKEYEDAKAVIRKLSGEFGLTPSARSKLTINRKTDNEWSDVTDNN